ncbi:MAG: hypothetical protein HY470_01875 [Candidatus Ryanbacteria bacterium]|nr:hypothetical protein [Candidatus Ryanbacteria bacterium]
MDYLADLQSGSNLLPSPGSRGARRLVKNRRIPIQTIVLRTLYAAGLISTALIAPNAIRLFGYLDRAKVKRNKFYDRVVQATSRLKKSGLIKIDINGKAFITDKGRAEVEKILVKNYTIPAPSFWDGKWRILIFDIQEKRKRARATLRTLLANAEFIRLQDSVWIHPYPCEEFILLVRKCLLSHTGEMRVIVAEILEADKALRKHFDLL